MSIVSDEDVAVSDLNRARKALRLILERIDVGGCIEDVERLAHEGLGEEQDNG